MVADCVGDVIGTVVLAVEANGGVVKDIAGDGVLALFDDPTDAVRAASSVIGGVRLVTAPGATAAGLDVRVGAAVGPVRFREVRGAGRTRATGPAISAAVRLEGRAEPGTALLTDELVGAMPTVTAEPSDRAEGAQVLRSVPGVRRPLPLPPREQRTSAGSSVAGRREERRTVVTLFAAVTRPDGGGGSAGDDGIVEEALARGVEIVERFGGTVKDLAGDVVVALFGAPIAHDDDRARAVHAGLALCAELPTVDATGRLAVQAGVAAGRVVVGAVGAGHRIEYGAVGDAMNTAARLEARAEAGTVLVAETARGGVEDEFQWGPPLAVAAKGKHEPVVARRALGAARPLPVLGSDPVTDALFIGRGEELGRVLQVVDRRACVLITGDAGLGKSALVRAAARTRDEDDWLVVRGVSWGRDRHLGAFVPFLEASRLSRARARPEQLEARAAEAFSARVAMAAAAGMAALVVEDVQWLDDGSRRVLAEVAVDAPVAIVATGRNGARSPFPEAEVLALGPLPPPDDHLLLEAVVGRAALSFDIERRILDVAAGNPLFLRAQLQARSVGERLLGHASDVPESIERLVLLRVDALEPSERAVVDALAVVGAPCSTSVISAIVGDEIDAVRHRTEALIEAGLVVTEGAHLALAHGAFGEAIYGAILQRARRELHRRAADAVAPTEPGAAARHWSLAGEPREAARLAADAAVAARARVSFQEAASLFGLAGRAGQEAGTPPARTCQLWLESGRCHLAAASLDAAMEAFAAASALALEAGDASTAATAAVGFENAMFETRRLRSTSSGLGRELLVAALDRADELDAASHARLLAAAGRERRFSVGAEAAAAPTDDAVALARDAGDASTIAYALTAWRVARESPEQLVARSATDAELIRAACSAGDATLEFEARRVVLMDQLVGGDLTGAWVQVRTLAALARRLGERRLAWLPPMWKAAELLVTGPFDAALAASSEVYEAGRRAAYTDVVAVHALQDYLARRQLGCAADAVPSFVRAGDIVGDRWQVFEASLRVELGDLEEARGSLAVVLADPDVLLGGDRVVGAAVALATDAVVAIGDAIAATQLSERLRPWSGQHVLVGTGAAYLGPVDFVLGRLAAVQGDERRARSYHRTALAAARKGGAPLAVAECALALASLEPRAESARLVDEARVIGEVTGSRRLVEAARQSRRHGQGGRP